MSEHWIEGWTWRPGAELPRADAEKHELHGRVWLRDDGQIDRVEAYRRGKLAHVTYHADAGDEASILLHGQRYPHVARQVIRVLARRDGFVWSDFHSYDGEGGVVHRALTLDDADGCVLLQIDRDADGRTTGFTKYFWPDAETLRYVFEYDAGGRCCLIQELGDDGGRVDFDDVAASLPDARFYADGLALPAPLSGTPIPEPP